MRIFVQQVVRFLFGPVNLFGIPIDYLKVNLDFSTLERNSSWIMFVELSERKREAREIMFDLE
jgi:hypothetical protein